MGRRPKQKTVAEAPDYEQMGTIEAVDTQIAMAKDAVCRKVKQQLGIKEAKKEADAAYNEQLKELAEEIDTAIGVLGGWETRKMQIAAGSLLADGIAIPTPSSGVVMTVPMPSVPFRTPA